MSRLMTSSGSGQWEHSNSFRSFVCLRNTDIVFHQNGEEISLSVGNLNHESTQISSGSDKFGSFVQIAQEWKFQNQIFSTSVESYENMAIFTQHYPAGLQNVSLGNHFIRTYFKRAPSSACKNISIKFYAKLLTTLIADGPSRC